MIVSLSSVFVNGLPPQCGLAPEGREKLRFRFFGFGMEKPTAYNAAGAAISRVPATSVSPAIELEVQVFVSQICDDFVSDENFSLARHSTRTLLSAKMRQLKT